VTFTWQLAPAARALTQLFVWLNAFGSPEPLIVKPEMVKAPVPVFDRVTACDELAVPVN
jgi:hypothetical protein